MAMRSLKIHDAAIERCKVFIETEGHEGTEANMHMAMDLLKDLATVKDDVPEGVLKQMLENFESRLWELWSAVEVVVKKDANLLSGCLCQKFVGECASSFPSCHRYQGAQESLASLLTEACNSKRQSDMLKHVFLFHEAVCNDSVEALDELKQARDIALKSKGVKVKAAEQERVRAVWKELCLGSFVFLHKHPDWSGPFIELLELIHPKLENMEELKPEARLSKLKALLAVDEAWSAFTGAGATLEEQVEKDPDKEKLAEVIRTLGHAASVEELDGWGEKEKEQILVGASQCWSSAGDLWMAKAEQTLLDMHPEMRTSCWRMRRWQCLGPGPCCIGLL